MNDQELQTLTPDSFLNSQQFTTEHDAKVDGYGIQQERFGMELGQNSHTIMIDRDGAWFAYKLDGGMASSNGEVIGTHANTADLLRGFLASPASLVVQTFTDGKIEYHCLKQCNHPAVMQHICPTTVFDLNLLAPMWRETTEAQYEHYLGCVPPAIYAGNRFLSGEPYTHNDRGQAIYLALKLEQSRLEGERYFAKMMTAAKFRAARS